MRWATKEGYQVDGRILDLASPRVPKKEPTVYHIAQVRTILAACKPDVPTEDLTVRLLVGSGIRRAEVCGLAVIAPDDLHDLMTDSFQRFFSQEQARDLADRYRWQVAEDAQRGYRRVVPSPAPLAIIEAPAITFDIPVFREYLVDGKDVRMAHAGDAEALARAMAALVCAAGLRQRLAQVGPASEHVDYYTRLHQLTTRTALSAGRDPAQDLRLAGRPVDQ